ncbi:MAG TPA: toll/interleukin-1 receptor domain-containing protein [Trebonia sp.]|nr:toll/interleukin-1 receptor domain-containing protein [Trebonia sp.]
MGVLRPRVFVSYSRKNEDLVRRVRADLFSSEVDCWIDASDILAGERLSPSIEAAIDESNLFFAYVTQDFLQSRWCMAEIRYALTLPTVSLAPYVDSQDTLDSVPSELLDEVAFGRLGPDNYLRSLLEISGRAWASLQVAQRLVPSEDHILAGPAIFDADGYSRADLIDRAREELIIAGPNLRSWLSDDDSKRGLVDLVKRRRVRVTLILATYETLRPIAPEGAVHLRESVKDIRQMLDQLDPGEERRLMSAHFHVGASTLSTVFVDPRSPRGILFFNPRWAIQFLPQDRLTCVIDKQVNSPGLYKAIYNGVLLMTQGDAMTVDDMLAARQ